MKHVMVMSVPAWMAVLVLTAATSAQPSTDDIRAVVAQVLTDAETRTSLLNTPGIAGYDDGFFLADTNDQFNLTANGVIGFRYTATLRGDDDDEERNDFEGGFSFPTVELELSGHVFDPRFVFSVEAEFEGDEGGVLALQDVYFGYEWDNGWALYAGQTQLPVLWEDEVDGENALAADTSVTNNIFSTGDAMGIWLTYTAERYRGWFAFSDGADSANLNFDEKPADYAFTNRSEFLFAGEWDDFEFMSSFPGHGFTAKLGLAAHWQDGPNDSAEDMSMLPYTIDLQLKGDGWNLYAAYVGRFVDIDASGEDFHDMGIILQGGVFIPDTDVELFARYDIVIADNDRANDDAFNTITAGVNWFLHGNAARFTFDAQYFINDTAGNELVDAYANDDGSEIGLLPSGEDGQVSLRAQFHVLF